MLDKNQALLRDTIESGFNKMQDLDPQSVEYSRAAESMTKLYQMKIEEDKADAEFRKAEAEKELNKSAKADRWIRVGLEIAGLAVYILSMGTVLDFETNGRITSTMGRAVFGRLRIPWIGR